ncbi:MAG: RdgB/HAM1 family non-canonical purine NTP pyrophosphatase [Fluviicola sp.]|nr:RdgB/HAM1 family non-canonical purine NTP pyrophosphatase [Fluviicola sp.]
MKLVFATANQNKVIEIDNLLPETILLTSLKELGQKKDIPETSKTIEGNAVQKANFITDKFNVNCFADDTGLEINALKGEPGVNSARYAGSEKDADLNIKKVLQNMDGITKRGAQFKTVIALNLNGEQHLFFGVVKGTIRKQRIGQNGFGYDPIFEPENCGRTFAEMTLEEKNKYSHRARAFNKMIRFLSSKAN